jgi:hypothetical protein
MDVKHLKTGNMIRFGGAHFKRLIRLQNTTGVKHFNEKDLAVCMAAETKTQKSGTNTKQKQNGGVVITKTTDRTYKTTDCGMNSMIYGL